MQRLKLHNHGSPTYNHCETTVFGARKILFCRNSNYRPQKNPNLGNLP
jgi:hypothetical protein